MHPTSRRAVDLARQSHYDGAIVTTIDPDNTQTSRRRLLAAAKGLFARLGFENTSTAAISREAGTSESQLVRYFHTKSGLLEAIFNESWQTLTEGVREVVVGAGDAREALAGLLHRVTEVFGQDPELAYLLLFEGRRVRADSSEILLSKGFVEFENLIRLLIHRGKKDGTFRAELNDEAIASTILGATEGMIRDRLMAQRAGKESPFSDEDIRTIFFALLSGLGAK
jgi:AcrR family transcriptional regulator